MKKKESTLVIALLCFMCCGANLLAQTGSSLAITTPLGDTTICTGHSLTLRAAVGAYGVHESGLTADDGYTGSISIGFPFVFYGHTYSNCLISSNGALCFDLSLAGSYAPPPISAGGIPGWSGGANCIMGSYTDLYLPAGGDVSYGYAGVYPNRRFIVNFNHVPLYHCTSLYATSQIILFETSNIAEVHIAHQDFCSGWGSICGIEGVEDSVGDSATAAPGRNYTAWTVTVGDGRRFTPDSGATTYRCDTIPYAPIFSDSAAIYWYAGGTLAGSGDSLTVSPSGTTSYTCMAVFAADTITARTTVHVGPPWVAPISGAASVPAGGTIALSDTTRGGYWGSSNPSIATVNSAGLVTGVAAGLDTIYYADSNRCGVTTVFYAMAVTPAVSRCSIITTVAGDAASGGGSGGFRGDGGPATSANLDGPYGVATDTAGNFYIADWGNQRIRKVDVAGTITTVAGNGSAGYSGDGGAATAAELYSPKGVAVDATGKIYIADFFNNVVRVVNTSGIINTLAGNGTAGYSGDGGAATAAELNGPYCVAVDAVGNLLIADYSNNRIRKVDPTGTISTIAGDGLPGFSGDGGAATDAKMINPTGVAVDAAGYVYIADPANQRVREVSPSGIISTIAGTGTGGYSGDGGPGTAATLNWPMGVTADGRGNLYIADYLNNVIRERNTAGLITTIAGNYTATALGDGGPATAAGLFNPAATAIDWFGNLLIADFDNNLIREVWEGYPVVAPLTGPLTVCTGATIALTDSTSGGGWASADSAMATVSALGVVTGVASGTVVISYTITGICGATSVTRSISVTAPVHGLILGPASICAGDTSSYTETLRGGTWSTSNPAVATITAGGVLTAVNNGAVTVFYTDSGACGIFEDTLGVTVLAINRISGQVIFGSSPIDTTGTLKVWLITYDSAESLLTAIDSVLPALHSATSDYYEFLGMAGVTYWVKAAYFPPAFDSIGYVPTYHTSSLHWSGADVFSHSPFVANDYINVNMNYGAATTGPGFIGGFVTSGADRGTASGIPVAGMLVLAINATTGTLIQQSYTDASGNYSFRNLPVGENYMIYPEALNYATTPYASISLSTGIPAVTNADFKEHTMSKTITPDGLGTPAVTPSQSPSVILFPNPAYGKITIQYFGAVAEEGEVTITDVSGKVLLQTVIGMNKGGGSNTMDISPLSAGIYLVHVNAGDVRLVKKLEVRK